MSPIAEDFTPIQYHVNPAQPAATLRQEHALLQTPLELPTLNQASLNNYSNITVDPVQGVRAPYASIFGGLQEAYRSQGMTFAPNAPAAPLLPQFSSMSLNGGGFAHIEFRQATIAEGIFTANEEIQRSFMIAKIDQKTSFSVFVGKYNVSAPLCRET